MQIDGPLDHVLKLPDIAQPVVILQRIPRFRGNPRKAPNPVPGSWHVRSEEPAEEYRLDDDVVAGPSTHRTTCGREDHSEAEAYVTSSEFKLKREFKEL